MRRRCRFAILCTVSVLGASTVLCSTAMADGESEQAEVSEEQAAQTEATGGESKLITIPYEQENAWDEVTMINDDVVSTGVNIRATADPDGEVLGFLYPGMAAWVLRKGEGWTELCSGQITGFVKNDYLLYGRDVVDMAVDYGLEGVATTWDDVKLFSGPDGGADVLELLKTGAYFTVIDGSGHWISVRYTDDVTAYVSEDDVQKVLILDKAVSKNEVYEGLLRDRMAGGAPETVPEESETYYEETEAPAQTEAPAPVQTEAPAPPQTETQAPPQTETQAPPQTETQAPPQTETQAPPQTETDPPVQTETDPPAQTETDPPAQTETDPPAQTDDPAGDDPVDVDPGDEGWYDADTDTYYDGNGNVISVGTKSAGDFLEDTYPEETYTEETYAEETAAEVTYTDDGTYTEETYAEETYAEETYAAETSAEEAYAEETSAEETAAQTEAQASGTDDTTLLASLIYCEAGNQSYEGQVAVGAVVMNRVNSGSFPNTISDVIYQSGQFTPASNGSLSSAIANGVPSTCYDAASAAINGENPVGSALYFNAGSGEGVQIGDHQFY